MKGEPGALPLMSFALRDLFEVEKTEKGEPMDLTLSEYRNRGGIAKALERHANQVFTNFSQEQKEPAKTVFSRLIEIGLDCLRTATNRIAYAQVAIFQALYFRQTSSQDSINVHK